MLNHKNKDLFGVVLPTEKVEPRHQKKVDAKKWHHPSIAEQYHICEFGNLTIDPVSGMPVIVDYQIEVPSRIVPINEATAKKDHTCTPCFYVDDRLFEKFYSKPAKYLSVIQSFPSVISTDFSQMADMPAETRRHNAYRNRELAAYWQANGVHVIYNVTWSKPDSYAYSFAAIPHHTMIAINCTGIIGCDASKYLWMKGYEEAIRILEPSLILRYGDIMPGEYTEISRYYQNEHLNRMRHGSKR